MDLFRRRPRGLYFEEFEIGQTITTAARTVTESDVVSFAGLTGDFNQIHIDAEFSQNSPFGQRVAHGLLVLSISMGLVVQTGVMEGTVLAFREIQEWKFSKPVFLGDTLHVELTVVETKDIPRLGGGSVLIEAKVMNQRAEIVNKGVWNALLASRQKGN
ncbi:MAG: dehydratase [Chloroflexi bacterium RBG_16_54_18]|nr:MAG: dehydratase [Chloroflexi bacterium RBG_16_54_18]